MQPSGSGGKKSMRVNASDNESLDSENEDIPIKASVRELRHPAKPIHRNDTTSDATVIFNEESDEEDYHTTDLQKFLSSTQVGFRKCIFRVYLVVSLQLNTSLERQNWLCTEVCNPNGKIFNCWFNLLYCLDL